MATLVVTITAEAVGSTLWEVSFSVFAPLVPPIPFPPPDPLDFLLGKLFELFDLPDFGLPQLPCPLNLGITIPGLPPIPLPFLPPIPFPPPDPLDFLIGKLAEFLDLPDFGIPQLPCPLDLGITIPGLPPIPLPFLPPIPFPPPDPLDFLIGKALPFLDPPEIEIPVLPCPVALGIQLKITIDIKP